jgi:hypothetical protein
MIPDNYYEFEARSDGDTLELRPRGDSEPVFVLIQEDLDFLQDVMDNRYHKSLTWVVVPETERFLDFTD